MGKTNVEDIQSVVNVTNQHTEVLKASTRYYEHVRDEVIAISEWVHDADDKVFGDENLGKRLNLIRNYTKQFDQNELIMKEINSAASVKKAPNSLAQIQYDQANQAFNKSTLFGCYYGLEYKNAVVYLDFSLPKIDESSEVLAVYPMEHYITKPGTNGSDTEYCYQTYTGPRHVLYNRTVECMTSLQENKVFDKTVRAQTCLTPKNEMIDNPSEIWKPINCTTSPPIPDESKVIIHMVDGAHKIYCYPYNITIDDGPEQPCPKNSFILESHARFAIGNIKHSGTIYDTNITRRTRSTRHENKTMEIYASMDDDFEQKCEHFIEPDSRTNPLPTPEIHLGSPDTEEEIAEKGRRFKRSPMPPPIISNSMGPPAIVRTSPVEEPTEKPRIRIGEKLRGLSKNLNFSLDAFKDRVSKLPGSLNFTQPDFDTLIDTPINLINDTYTWIIAHIKSLTTMAGFLTGCMVFVMIMPIVELIFLGIKIAKVPISLWISSLKRATRRVGQLKQELALTQPLRQQARGWDIRDKYV